MIPEKRLDLLIEALAYLKQSKSLKLLLVGDGALAYVESLKKLAKSLNLENRVLFRPTVHRTKVPEYYSASDIAVFPASSISIIEAMSTGLPVIIGKSFVSRCELEYGNGFSFDVRGHGGDFDTLIAHLQKLISDPELRARMGKRSRDLVEDKLNWEKIAKTYLNLYKMAVEKAEL
jgi:phosphatidylinositol alpha-1,6-mannosyltransferase